MSTTFTAGSPAPLAERFRNGDIWRAPNGRLYAVGSQQGLSPGIAALRPCGWGETIYRRWFSTTGWTRATWGRQP